MIVIERGRSLTKHYPFLKRQFYIKVTDNLR
jgi:hypothetical protein